MKNFRFAAVAVALACLLTASPALAGGDRPAPYEPIDAQAIIDACREGIDVSDRTMALEDRQQEVNRLNNCYKSAIHRLMAPMFDPGLFSQEDAERLLVDMHGPAFLFYAYLLTWHRECDCGEDAEIAFRLAALKPYESILKGIGDVRKQYSR